jgi:hypothetical protein
MPEYPKKGIITKIVQLFDRNRENSLASRRKTAQKLNGSHVRYVTERKNNVDEVIGREGHMNITTDETEFAVVCGIDTLFRAKIEEMTTGELLSHDGVILTAFDLETQKERTVIAYYKYYR